MLSREEKYIGISTTPRDQKVCSEECELSNGGSDHPKEDL